MKEVQTIIRMDDGRIHYDMSERNNPCFDCGACCFHFRVSFYHGELDSQPGGHVPAGLATQVTPFHACMKGTETGGGRCIALREDGRCDIYALRPSTCREFRAVLEDGTLSPECLRLRALYGIGNGR